MEKLSNVKKLFIWGQGISGKWQQEERNLGWNGKGIIRVKGYDPGVRSENGREKAEYPSETKELLIYFREVPSDFEKLIMIST